MCFKLDNGSELFSIQDMQKLKKAASGRMGSRDWISGETPRPGTNEDSQAEHECACGGNCGCNGKCVTCKCAELRARKALEAERGHGAFGYPEG
jgi:hypothetical protein